MTCLESSGALYGIFSDPFLYKNVPQNNSIKLDVVNVDVVNDVNDDVVLMLSMMILFFLLMKLTMMSMMLRMSMSMLMSMLML